MAAGGYFFGLYSTEYVNEWMVSEDFQPEGLTFYTHECTMHTPRFIMLWMLVLPNLGITLVYRRAHPTFLQWSTPVTTIGDVDRPPLSRAGDLTNHAPTVRARQWVAAPFLHLPDDATRQRLPHHRADYYRCSFTVAPWRSSTPPPAIQVPWRFTTTGPPKSYSCHAQTRKCFEETKYQTESKRNETFGNVRRT
ncbi:uncharacterized protein LOC125507358 [Triticum urartu]|uniref:uncharacterized protein LOC125507358 n=1 Tax=Triticum urartu TaxID=4572 RepID=UPI002043AB74|nr:uncharacterized protein LOC125507358 [Triticum urartu]